MNYYLAVDIGASSGRHILGCVNNGKIELEEIYRFENGMKEKNGHLVWDTELLFHEILSGMRKCREIGKIPTAMGIDTWGVDYVLLDNKDNVIGETYGYRDRRTEGMDEEVYKIIPQKDLYLRTGIQKQMFNTIYQLMSVKVNNPEHLDKAESFLMLPDYFQFLLTGKKANEYTNATTGQLISPKTGDWDYELIDMLGYPRKLFKPVVMPGTVLGNLNEETKRYVGFDCTVVIPCTHDTGSAVAAVPSTSDDCLYISSGTWSLMGIESPVAIANEESMKANLTNEGGIEKRYRVLKNIMGLWMIQSVRHEYNDAYSFAELCSMAENEKNFPSRVDVNDASFLAPKSMEGAIREYLNKTGQKEPENIGQLATVIYQSLAESYADTIKEIEAIDGRHFDAINIVGGGSNAAYLNELTAKKTGRKVFAGPGEATAIGNLLVQMLGNKEFANLKDARKCVFDSFGVKEF